MTAIAPTLQAFFTERLINQRHASPKTIAAYRDTWRLLVGFAAGRRAKQPCALDFDDIGTTVVAASLDHLETDRGNSVRTRNARLAAVRSMFRFAVLQHPEHASTIARALDMPPKRYDRKLVTYLTETEVAALVGAPDTTTWAGRRDQALLLVAAQTGLRISELIGLTRADVALGAGAHAACHGKGRKDRVTPLTSTTVRVLRAWLVERAGTATDPLFPTRTGSALSRDATEHRIALHSTTATTTCPSLRHKQVSAHVLRHSAAMRLLEAGVDTTVTALWLGHEKVDTTAIYLHADLTIKERALARTTPSGAKPGRYRPPDSLLAFLEPL
jgi:site-specific recombinase XerD